MTLRELLAAVVPAKLEAADDPRVPLALHDSEGSDAPLLVRLFTVIGTWIGAALVAVLVVALELHRVAPLAVVLFTVLFLNAIMLSRRPARSLAMTQLIWAMTLGAEGLALAAQLEVSADETLPALSLTGLQLAALFLIRVPSLQLISAVCCVGFATWFAGSIELPNYALWVALPVVGLVIAAWILEVPWAARLGRTWSALAYGLPIGLVIPLATISLDAEPAFAARNVPGLAIALLWLMIAHSRKSIELQGLALSQLAGFLFLLYYQLDTTLLLKSLWVIGTGVVILLAGWLLHAREHESDPTQPRPERRSRWLPAIGLALFGSSLVIGASLIEERILATGQTVLLPLAPVDPRSLMQGDYMALRYTLEQEIDGALDGAPRHGTLVLTLDEHGVGRFERFDDGSPLAADEQRLEYRLREQFGGRIRVGAEAFFFEEGSAYVYQGARFGELVIAGDGEAVLVGLRDENRQPLGVRLHDR